MERFEVVVIGAGMIGSAAARHLAEAGRRVAVIGPSEPVVWSTSAGPFASHYDSGRITRISARKPVWAELAGRSIARYHDIEQRSDMRFHRPIGLAWIVDTDRDDIDAVVASAVERGGHAELIDRGELEERTGIRAPDRPEVRCGFESPPAGLVDPRRLVVAQLRLAIDAGAEHLADAVTSMTAVGGDGPSGAIRLEGRFGTVEAEGVLLATGAYGGGPAGLRLGLQGHLRTTVRAEIGPGETIPSLIAHTVDNPDLRNYIYWVPPVRYPDGRTLLKIGGDHIETRAVAGETPAGRSEINRWFTTAGSDAEAAALLGTIRSLLPAAEIRSWDAVPCVVTESASGLPLVGRVDDRLAVALGGNGAAAKSSDEIGRLAAGLFEADPSQPADHPIDETIDGSLLAPIPA